MHQAILEKIIAETKMERKAFAHNYLDRYLFYQYGNMPVIILDLLEKKICTTKGMLEKYGEKSCQQQASILMRLLKEHKQANFKRVTVTVNPYRIGTSVEDRKITYQAIEHLLKKSKIRSNKNAHSKLLS